MSARLLAAAVSPRRLPCVLLLVVALAMLSLLASTGFLDSNEIGPLLVLRSRLTSPWWCGHCAKCPGRQPEPLSWQAWLSTQLGTVSLGTGGEGEVLPETVFRNSSLAVSSVVFHHHGHAGGSAIRLVLERLCSKLNLVCVGTAGHCVPTGIKYHSVDILYGHFNFDVQRVLRLMRGRPLLFAIVRDPYQVARSGYWWKRSRNWTPSEFIENTFDTCAQAVAGLNTARNARVPDPGCVTMMKQAAYYDALLPYEHHDAILAQFPFLLPREWVAAVADARLFCAPQANIITKGSNRSQIFDQSITHAERRKLMNSRSCHQLLYDKAVSTFNATWGEIERAFQQMCSTPSASK